MISQSASEYDFILLIDSLRSTVRDLKFSLLTNHSQGDLNPKIWEVFAILG